MSGLLRQLQKPKSRFANTIADVLITSTGSDLPLSVSGAYSPTQVADTESAIDSSDGNLQHPVIDGPANDIGAHSPRDPGPPITVPDGWDSTESRVIRRRKTIEADELPARSERGPQWLIEQRKSVPQVESLVPLARQLLNDILPASGEADVDLGSAVHKAVDLAVRSAGKEVHISKRDQEAAERELVGLLVGKGPLQALYDDNSVTDIIIDSHRSIKALRHGKIIETPFCFRSGDEYKQFVTAMLRSSGSLLSSVTPIADCVLDDKWRSRVNALDPSVVDGPEPKVVIRVPRLQQFSFYDVLQGKILPVRLAAWLTEAAAIGQTNFLVSGPIGSGKTLMATALLSAVSADERLIVVEEVPEIAVPAANLERLVARPANAQGEGEVRVSDLLRAAMRRTPHRITVGELRNDAGPLFLRAVEAGHIGSIATIHAEHPTDALWRLLDMVAAYERAPQESIMRRVSRSIHLILAMRNIDDRPCLYELCEVQAPANGEFTVVPLVRYHGEVNGRRQWKLQVSTSFWLERLQQCEVELQAGPGLLPPDDQDGTCGRQSEIR